MAKDFNIDKITHGSDLKLLADQFPCLSLNKCYELPYDFAVKNERNVLASWTTNCEAGKGWCLGFKKPKHSSIRSPEGISASERALLTNLLLVRFSITLSLFKMRIIADQQI